MRLLPSLLLVLGSTSTLSLTAGAQTPTWRHYTTGNTGIQGDYAESVWIGPDDAPWIGAYTPAFEEGGVARFLRAENRWEGISSLDHPEVFGAASLTGASRVHDMVEDSDGKLWLATWRGLVHLDPAVGAESLVGFDASNSPHPGGRTMDVDVAPDGTVWAAVFGVAWGTGGLLRYDPSSEVWTVWSFGSTANNWPSTGSSCERVSVWSNPGGGYRVFVRIANTNQVAVFNSKTDQFQVIPSGFDPGTIVDLAGHDAVDDAGNLWVFRIPATGGIVSRLEVLRSDGTWFVPPMPPGGSAFVHAFGDLQAISVDGNENVSRFDGASWIPYGGWNDGGTTYAAAVDSVGGVWVTGIGGAGYRDPQSGVWERHRVTNSSQGDYWVNDIAIGAPGEVWSTANYSPGVGGMQRFDGERWLCFNNLHHGLGESWPFPTDNASAMTWRASKGSLAVAPMNQPIVEWDGSQFVTLPGAPSGPESIVEDSLGRLWSLGTYFTLQVESGGSWVDVPIAGWGENIVADPSAPGSVWACANLEVVRTDGTARASWLNTDLPELNPLHDTLTSVAVAPDGTAWVGSTNGLFHLNPFDGTHQHWGPSDGLPGEWAWPLAVTPDGRLWFSNRDADAFTEDGLCWFDGSSFGVIPVEAGGLPHGQIYDAEQRAVPGGYELWLSCASRGIAVMTLESPATHVAYGCDLNPEGSFVVLADATLGGQLEVALSNPVGSQAAGSLAFLGLSTPGLAAPCGLMLDGFGMTPGQPGELLVAFPLAYLSPGVVWGGGAASDGARLTLPIPQSSALLGKAVVAQGVLLDLTSPVPTIGLTRGALLEIGL